MRDAAATFADTHDDVLNAVRHSVSKMCGSPKTCVFRSDNRRVLRVFQLTINLVSVCQQSTLLYREFRIVRN